MPRRGAAFILAAIPTWSIVIHYEVHLRSGTQVGSVVWHFDFPIRRTAICDFDRLLTASIGVLVVVFDCIEWNRKKTNG